MLEIVAYRLRKGRLERMTSDHSLVQALVDERVRDTRSEIIEDDQDITRSVGMSELKKHQKNPLIKQIIHLLDAENKTEVTIDEIRRYVTETLGKHFNKTEKLTPDIRTEELHHDDIILLCTDGLSDVLTDDEIRAIIERHKENMLDAAQSLIKAAANRSTTSHLRAKPDDITAIVQRFKTT